MKHRSLLNICIATRSYSPSLLALPLLVLLVHSASAADVAKTGALRGAVTAVGANNQTYNVPGATIKLSGNLPASQPLSAVSDETGQYRSTALGPGLYTIEVMLDGFKTLTRKITIRAGETNR